MSQEYKLVPITAGSVAAEAKKKRKKRLILSVLSFLLLVAAAVGLLSVLRSYYYKVYPQKYNTMVEQYCQVYGVPTALVYAVIKTESNFTPDAVSVNDARGLMQLLPETFEWLQLKLGEQGKYDTAALFEPEVNIRYGVYLLSVLQEEFGSIENIAAAYHAGIGAVGQWLSDPDISADGVTLDRIPYEDTALYVKRIKENIAMYQKLYGS